MEAIIGLVILFWVVSSILGMFGKNQRTNTPNRPRRRPPSIPTFGGPDMPVPPFQRTSDDGGRLAQEEPGRATADMSPAPTRVESAPEFEGRTEFQREVARAGMNTDQAAMKELPGGAILSHDLTKGGIGSEPEQTTPAHPLMDRNNIVNGIVWSEVLGTPKSRRRMR